MSDVNASVDVGGEESNNENNLLAGHAPAQIVGGKRVAQPKRRSSKEANVEQPAGTTPDEAEESARREAEVKDDKHVNAGHFVSGQLVQDKEAFPTEAVRSFHEQKTASRSIEDKSKPISHRGNHELFQPSRRN